MPGWPPMMHHPVMNTMVVNSRREIPGCPITAEDLNRGTAVSSLPEKFEVTREELIALVEEAMRAAARG